MNTHTGKQAAIKAAGGLRALGRLLGLSAPSIFDWERIPAERLLDVEKVTKVPRHKLRPDLFKGYVREPA